MLRYLITTNNNIDTHPPIMTDYFDAKRDFNKAIGMIVFDLRFKKYTADGVNWEMIVCDGF